MSTQPWLSVPPRYARTSLRLPDAYALATAMGLEHRGRAEVRLATFDKKVLRARRELHRSDFE